MKDDNISRQAARSFAAGSGLIRRMKDGDWIRVEEVRENIDMLPSVDAVQVVRCGQCEHWKCNPTTNKYGVCNKVSYDEFEVVMHSDDFCSYGSNMRGNRDD